MNFIIEAFNQVLYRPLFNLLVFFYNTISFQDLGIAIIFLTVLIRLILYPLSKKSIRSQKEMAALQPKIKEIQKKYPHKEEQAKAMMALYQEHKINPLAGCLPILVQLPILIALYRVFYSGLNGESLSALYSFIPRPESFHASFLGLVDLSQRSVILAVLAGILQFIQAKTILPATGSVSNKSSDFSQMMNKQMLYFMPAVTIFVALGLPAALPLYWTVLTLFGILQQYLTPARAIIEKS